MGLVLALDTATEECAVGLATWDFGGDVRPTVLGEVNLDAPRAALGRLVPTASRLLEACSKEIAQVDAVVVGRGPGSFTGVRIGMSTAKGIAQALRVPLWGVGTLDAVAERLSSRDGLLGVVGDAMRGEVYPVLFRCSGGVVERLSPDRVLPPGDAAAEWADALDEPVLLAGNGLSKYGEVFAEALGDRARITDPRRWTPTGAALIGAAWRARVDRLPGDPAVALPIYTRLSDAEEAEGRRCPTPPSGVAGPDGKGT